MNIDKVEKNKYILFIKIFIILVIIAFIFFVFINKEEKVKNNDDQKLDVNFLSQIGTELFDNIKYIEVQTCLEEYDGYFSKCKIDKKIKIEDKNKISKIIDNIDNINSLDEIEELPSNISTGDLRGKSIINLYYNDSSTAELTFLDNYLMYSIERTYGIVLTFYDYGNNNASNYVKTIK